MDAIDYKIVRLLQDNGRMSIKRIAETIHLTPPAVAGRIKKLEESGIISYYEAVVDHKKLGMNIKAIINITMGPEKRREFIEFARNKDSILECHHVTGGSTMSIKAIFKDMSELDSLVGQIQQYGNTQTLIVLSTPIKRRGTI